jgi:tetratricopeptide (TPR) repeat protein
VCEGRPRDGVDRATEALAAARRAGDMSQQAWAHSYRAWGLRKLGEQEAGLEDIHEAADLFEAAGDLHGSLQAKQGHALVLMEQGRTEEALAAYQGVDAFLEEARDRIEPHVAVITRIELHSNIGMTYAQLEQWDEAVAHLRIAVDLYHENGNTAMESRRLNTLGTVLLDAGRTAEAHEVFRRTAVLGPGADPRIVAEARERVARLEASGT